MDECRDRAHRETEGCLDDGQDHEGGDEDTVGSPIPDKDASIQHGLGQNDASEHLLKDEADKDAREGAMRDHNVLRAHDEAGCGMVDGG